MISQCFFINFVIYNVPLAMFNFKNVPEIILAYKAGTLQSYRGTFVDVYREKTSRAEKMASKIFKLLLIIHIVVLCVCAKSIENSKGTDKEAENPKLVSNNLKDSEKILWPLFGIQKSEVGVKQPQRFRKNSMAIIWDSKIQSWCQTTSKIPKKFYGHYLGFKNPKLVSNNLKDSEKILWPLIWDSKNPKSVSNNLKDSEMI
uniref:uncharacterized protein LOC120334178 isoform X1 n=1 Tax=Styela clava TaxID=7725 RepID=UPI00193949AD|nr:uncharacterized protein LOC120334178 isoform X1 [Styela clava]